MALRSSKLLELLDIERQAEIDEFDDMFKTLSKKVVLRYLDFRNLKEEDFEFAICAVWIYIILNKTRFNYYYD